MQTNVRTAACIPLLAVAAPSGPLTVAVAHGADIGNGRKVIHAASIGSGQ